MSEWFAHRFADHVDQLILRPGQVDYYMNPESPGHSAFHGAMSQMQLSISRILTGVKRWQLNRPFRSTYADSFVRDLLTKPNQDPLTYRGTQTPSSIANTEPSQLKTQYAKFKQDHPNWQNEFVPPKEPTPIQSRRVPHNLGGQ